MGRIIHADIKESFFGGAETESFINCSDIRLEIFNNQRG
jgi:hypothetical protein